MRKIFLVIILLFSIVLFGTVLAREPQEAVVPVPEVLELPNPGLKPGDFFYFLDGWGEAIGEFFTFNPEARAILQTERALERIAEVNALLEEKGVDAPGLDVAEAKIQRNIARANEILEREQIRGRDIASLAEQLNDKFTIRRKLLNQVFEQRRQAEKASIKRVRDEIRQALEAEELDKISELRSAIKGARTQRERLDNRRRKIQDRIFSEGEQIKRKMRPSVIEVRRLEREKEALVDEGERMVEMLFEEREIALETKEEILEIQLNEAILAEDIVLIEQIHSQLAEVELQAEVLGIEETQFEEKIETEIEELETAIEIILETRDDLDDLKMMANKAVVRAKEAIERAKAKAEEQNIYENPTIMGLIKQAERFHERALILFEQEEYKKSYLASKKAIDFAGKAFKLISVKENLRRERPDLPIFPDILPVEPIIIPAPVDEFFQEISPERVKEQIERTEQIIEKTRRLTEHEDVEAIVFPVVKKLIQRAEYNIDKAEILLKEGILNSAHRHAIEARGMAEKAYKIMQKKLQTGEIKITPEPTERIAPIVPPLTEKAMRCQTDEDCKKLICIMLIGYDTPQCGPDGFCFCGPGKNFEEILERL